MADIKQDLLSLQYSQNFAIQGTQEENIDLQLPPAPPASATVSGVVTDGTNPIPNATVKLFDSTGMPYQHTLTDSTGVYTRPIFPQARTVWPPWPTATGSVTPPVSR